LTDAGRAEHKKQHDILYAGLPFDREYVPVQEDKDGWSRWQGWDLMNTFGHLLRLGNMNPPFDTNILIDDKS